MNRDDISWNVSLVIARLSAVAILLVGSLWSWAIVLMLSKNATILLLFGLVLSVAIAVLGAFFIKNTFTKKFKKLK